MATTRDKEKKREYDKRYREKNKERLNKQKREYYQANKEKVKEKNDKWREANKDSVREKKRLQYRVYKEEWLRFLASLVKLECSSCGYDKTFAALDFHHTRDKVFHIPSKLMKAPTEPNKREMAEEVAKCIVLCANCHRELHHK